MSEDKFIEVKNLEETYDNGYQAIKSVSFSVKKGELVCLLGPSGCGKTTTLNMIAGLLNPTGGDILVNGESVLKVAPKNRNIGYVFQNYALYPHMTVLQNIMFPLTVGKNKIPKEDAVKIADKYMKLTHIEALAKEKPGNLSGGQQQRVSIARALVQEPDILLMDEPLSNLDARLRLKIREEIRTLIKEINITTLFVTHDQEEALSIGDKIILFNDGIIQQDDAGQDLYLNPKNQFVANFIGNPVIDNFEIMIQDGQIIASNFKILISELEQNRLKKELISGNKYTFSIRPEYVVPSEDGILEAEIDDVELIGRERVLKFTDNKVKERSLINLEQVINSGDKVKMKMNLQRAFIFDEKGERVY